VRLSDSSRGSLTHSLLTGGSSTPASESPTTGKRPRRDSGRAGATEATEATEAALGHRCETRSDATFWLVTSWKLSSRLGSAFGDQLFRA
jgi:hypothetical protein